MRCDDHDSECIFASITLFVYGLCVREIESIDPRQSAGSTEQFEEAAELFATAARIEAQLAATAQQHGQTDTALVHLVSEMSCWAAAGDTYRALSRGQQLLALSTLTPAQRTHISDFVQQVTERRRTWMQSWNYAVAAT